MANVILRTVPYVALWIATTGFAALPRNVGAASQDQTERTGQNTKKMQSLIYTNKTFRFRFTLPQRWKGYSISTSEWGGGDGVAVESGKDAPPLRVYWQGPTVGFDFGGNASKFFALSAPAPRRRPGRTG